MAWQDEMVPMLRVLVNDLDVTPTYSDGRLEELLVVAAHFVVQEIEFTQAYSITISTVTISPDPTTLATVDTAFMNFTVLKAACLVDQSTYRQKALAAGIKARCGPAVLETMGYLAGFKDLIELGPCAAYETLKKEEMFGNSNVAAVLSPFISNDFDPKNLSYNYSEHRSDYKDFTDRHYYH